MNTKILAAGVCLFIILFVIELVRREKLTFKYAAGWILAGAGGVVVSLCDRFLTEVAHILGFQLPSNFVFFAVLCGFVFLSLLLTIFLCQQNQRNDRIAQKLGLLEHELEQLKKPSSFKDGKL